MPRTSSSRVDPYMRGRMTGVAHVRRAVRGGRRSGRRRCSRPRRRVACTRGSSRATGCCRCSAGASRASWPATTLRKLDPAVAPPSTALGVLGMPGFTAWVGLVDIGQVKEGETIYVSGAAGAVGSAAAQIAKLKGLRVIGSAGSAEKVDWLASLGIEAFNYRETKAKDALADGIDVYFDNVGGDAARRGAEGAAAVRARRSRAARSRATTTSAPSRGRATWPDGHEAAALQGFIVFDHNDRFAAFAAEVGPWLADGKIVYRETIVDGIEKHPGTRSPASSAATTSARCSSASAPTIRARTNARGGLPRSATSGVRHRNELPTGFGERRCRRSRRCGWNVGNEVATPTRPPRTSRTRQTGASKSASQRVRSCSIGSSFSSFAFSSSSVALSRFLSASGTNGQNAPRLKP